MDRARRSPTSDAVPRAVGACFAASDGGVVLAVSGGLDSMVLLDAALRVSRHQVLAVATFDHRSGAHGAVATALVREVGEARGVEVIIGTAPKAERTEAAWRAARWSFLREVARARGSAVATAHTFDDQVETVCMRVLRGAGARGLAALYAPSPVLRPLLDLRRSDVAAYAAAAGVRHAEDPTNASAAYLRNRLRSDLLPAIARVRPRFAAEMTNLARRAAAVRLELDGVARRIAVAGVRGAMVVPRSSLLELAPDGVAALAPALAARAGIILDRRGTTRLSQFILNGRAGARIQLSGGGEAVRIRDDIVIRRTVVAGVGTDERPLAVGANVGAWRFRRVTQDASADAWSAALPADRTLTVRGWRAGDRMRAAGSPAARRVKRYFSDAGIAAPERIGWPVVLADGEIVWIPGVRRSDAATDRSGRPVLRYRCERNDV